ncbi:MULTISPECIES: hemolysin family protein [Actinoalloteichus]|uniref:CBS domain-containing protein n=1 Tax=Actinoalloteichus fjordicus TaxID=1612552 RepID=A0AAC9PRH2_9PSEU|nr:MULTISPECIES: hemolysin family protein [Actinoalloteichus]APU14344.1 CBS domain-containing protein [Actinoalloteichus fjordicus]APU20313.1 CBS domain-containing protein [Actinoalloteichus sp. GBA129-24]
MSDGMAVLVAVLLLVLNFFFVGAEFALLSSRRDRLEGLAEQGHKRAKTVMKAGKEISLMLAGAQLGITMCTVGLGALGEPAVAHQLERVLEPLGVPEVLLHPIAFVIALSLINILHIMLGEMVPKNLAIAAPEKMAMWLVPAHVGFVRVTRPLIGTFNIAANGILRLMKVEPKDELASAYTAQEMTNLFAESRREGLLEDSEHRRLAKTLSSAERTVGDVLVPVAELTTIPEHPSIGDVEQAVSSTGFSRFPVQAGDGRLVGYLHVKDVLEQADADRSAPVTAGRVRSLPELPANMRLDEALTTLRRAHSHLAAAVGAEGEVLGVVALEDLVEEYVGTVRDGTHVRSIPRPAN